MFGLPPGPVMNGMTNAPQKIICAQDLPGFVLRDEIVRAHLSQALVSMLCVRQPNRSVKVAEPARGLLDVWFLETNGATEFEIAGVAFMHDSGEKGFYPPPPILFQRLMQRVLESFVSGQEASVYQRSAQVHIVKGGSDAITHRSKSMAHGQSSIPQHL